MKINHQRSAGVLVPVFALRSKNDLGIGDTECVREMIDWCAAHKFSILQLLPINETGDDNSPYNAISSLAVDPTTITISLDCLPDFTENTLDKTSIDELRKGPVQYRKVKALKLQLLRSAFTHFLKNHYQKNTSRDSEFRSFLETHRDWIDDYALFRTLMELHQGLQVWEQWPQEHQTPDQAHRWILSQPASKQTEFKETILFFCYIQWIAHQQWIQLKEYGSKKRVGLMGDIPFGIGRYSSDVWANRQLFDLRWSCGAPAETFFKPDLFTERWGQNWGIPLYRWDQMKNDGYRWWKNRVRGTSSIFHLFRIDHVLGFYRIYAFPWKPQDNHLFLNLSHDEVRAKTGDFPRFWPGDDSNDEQKQFNQQHGEELLSMVLDAAGETQVVAEDLGCVPDYVRPSLTKLGIPGFKIPLFERNHDGSYKDSNQYQALSLITPATHDHEPMTSLWNRWREASEGFSEKQHLLRWIGWDPSQPPNDFTADLHAAIIRKNLSSTSNMAIFMITDLFAQTQRFNVPGPMSDSNWTERLTCKVQDFDRIPEIYSRIQKIDSSIHETRRG